jgi:hypothetical protein
LTYFQDKSSLKEVSGHRLKSKDKAERREAGEGEERCANKPHKRVSEELSDLFLFMLM